MEKTLQLIFRNEEGSLYTLSLGFPREDLTEQQVSAAMDLVINSDIFDSTGGKLVSKVRARLVERGVQEIAAFEE